MGPFYYYEFLDKSLRLLFFGRVSDRGVLRIVAVKVLGKDTAQHGVGDEVARFCALFYVQLYTKPWHRHVHP